MSEPFLLGLATGMAIYAVIREVIFPAISRRLALNPSLARRLGLNGGR